MQDQNQKRKIRNLLRFGGGSLSPEAVHALASRPWLAHVKRRSTMVFVGLVILITVLFCLGLSCGHSDSSSATSTVISSLRNNSPMMEIYSGQSWQHDSLDVSIKVIAVGESTVSSGIRIDGSLKIPVVIDAQVFYDLVVYNEDWSLDTVLQNCK